MLLAFCEKHNRQRRADCITNRRLAKCLHANRVTQIEVEGEAPADSALIRERIESNPEGVSRGKLCGQSTPAPWRAPSASVMKSRPLLGLPKIDPRTAQDEPGDKSERDNGRDELH